MYKAGNMVRTIRDILAIIGGISLGWCVWAFHGHTDRAFTQGLLVAAIGLGIAIWAVHLDHDKHGASKEQLQELRIRNAYLEAAIKQREMEKEVEEE